MNNKCGNFLLCLLGAFRDDIIRTLGAGGLPKEVKARLVEQLVKGIDVSSICNALNNVEKFYYREVIDGLRDLGYCVVDVVATLDSKLLVGASGGSLATVFEVGLSWDPVIGLPFVPAPSIKGVIRSWAIRYCVEKYSSISNRRSCIEDFLVLTGIGGEVLARQDIREYREALGLNHRDEVRALESSIGSLFVADAYPVKKGRGLTGCGILVPDVLTPHYYRGGELVDNEFKANPVPVVHLAVVEGTMFRFLFGVPGLDEELRKRLASHLGLHDSIDEAGILFTIVSSAFMEGIGARTSKGYGFFNPKSMRRLNNVCASAPTRSRRIGRISWRGEPVG